MNPLSFTPHSKNEKTYLGGTNAFSPSMPPPCDPGACAYAQSSKSKLCSCAGFIPVICEDIFSSIQFARKAKLVVVVVVFLDQRAKIRAFFKNEEKFLHQKVVKFLDKFDSLFRIYDECTTCMCILLELQIS